MGGWIFFFVYLLIASAIHRWWSRHFPRTWRYCPGRKWRTSRVWMFFKACLIILPYACGVGLLIGAPLGSILAGTFFGVLALVIFMEIGSRLVLGWWYSDNPGYWALLKDGWDPFFDTWLMGLVNTDPEEVQAGKPPACIDASNWIPPSEWTHRCPSCGATQPDAIFWCWNCKRGFEHGCEKAVCPNCDTTFIETVLGQGRTTPITCPGCGQAWQMPNYLGPN